MCGLDQVTSRRPPAVPPTSKTIRSAMVVNSPATTLATGLASNEVNTLFGHTAEPKNRNNRRYYHDDAARDRSYDGSASRSSRPGTGDNRGVRRDDGTDGNGSRRSRSRNRSRSRGRDHPPCSPESRSRRNPRPRPSTTSSSTRGHGFASHGRPQSRGTVLAESPLVSDDYVGPSSCEDGGGGIVPVMSLMQEVPRSSSRNLSSSGSSSRFGPRKAHRADPNVSLLKDTKNNGVTGRSGSISRVGGGSNGGSVGGGATARGMEPAVKGWGLMTTETFLKLVTFSVMAYCAIKLWTVHYDPSSGRLCSFLDKHKCVTSTSGKALLTLSRVTAGGLFPSIAICMLSKCYASRYFLNRSWLALVVSFEPAHELHTYFGSLTFLLGVIHGCAHIARAFSDGDGGGVLVEGQLNRSGLVVFFLLVLIVVPMTTACLKKSMTFELRKALHMLFIPFTVAMCFHGMALRVLCIILLAWYLVDRVYFTTRMSFHIERPVFRPVGRGTFVRFELPPGYQFKVGAYIQVNCPAISAMEWHPFSIFPVPGSRPRAGFHAEVVGDWTQELFRLSLEDPRMSLWITVAQPSVLEKSMFFDNVLLVCTGAGITPAVSLGDMFSKKKKNVYLMWLSREAGMVAMFEKQLRRMKSTVHLTGKPSAKTKQRMIDLLAPSKHEVVSVTPAESRSSSYVDLTALEAGSGSGVDTAESERRSYPYRGELKMDDVGTPASHRRSRSSLSSGGGSSTSRSARNRRVPFGQPISLNFGRPDIEKFIAETIQGTAREGMWVTSCDVDARSYDGCSQQHQQQGEVRVSPPRTEGEAEEDLPLPSPERREGLSRKVLARLNTNLMSADLSVITAADTKSSPAPSSRVRGETSATNSQTGAEGASSDPRTWLVLYCGANAKVERAVATACDGMGVTWRKEYFGSW